MTKEDFSSEVESIIVRVNETVRYDNVREVVYNNNKYPETFPCSDPNCKSNNGFAICSLIRSAIEKKETKVAGNAICDGWPSKSNPNGLCVSQFQYEIEIIYKK